MLTFQCVNNQRGSKDLTSVIDFCRLKQKFFIQNSAGILMSYAFQLSPPPFIYFKLKLCGPLVLEYAFISKLLSNHSHSIHSYIHIFSTDGFVPIMFTLN